VLWKFLMHEHPTAPFASAAPPRYLPVKTCANALQLTYKAMWSIVVSGNGPSYVRIGTRSIRVSEDDFLKWLDARKNG
jgi:predicted DNA-binding transcriptional regulator AlpA